MCEWVRFAVWLRKRTESDDEMLWKDVTYFMLKKKHILYLCDNLFCKIASDDRILALLNVCVVERHAISLNQSTSLFKK